ncbi:hypothetical protein PFISCL1PPCAC_6210, partial [Pristionchus fissidentatus]
VTNRAFNILSIIFLIVGVLLSAVGITLIIVSSTTTCVPAESPACPTVDVAPECHAQMFGAQLSLDDTYKWSEDLTKPDTELFKEYADKVRDMVLTSLEGPTSNIRVYAASDVQVSYDVQVSQFG